MNDSEKASIGRVGLWGIAIKNAVALICWAILAVYFGKWWLALFAYLFVSSASVSVREKRKED